MSKDVKMISDKKTSKTGGKRYKKKNPDKERKKSKGVSKDDLSWLSENTKYSVGEVLEWHKVGAGILHLDLRRKERKDK